MSKLYPCVYRALRFTGMPSIATILVGASSAAMPALFLVSLTASSVFAQGWQRDVVSQTITVNPGDYIAGGDGYGYCPSTGSYSNERNVTTAAAIAIVREIGLKKTWGALAVNVLAQMFQAEIRQSGGTGKEIFENLGLVESYASCHTITLAAPPPPARIVGIQASATDGANGWDMRPCNRDGNGRYSCSIGWSEWVWSQSDRVVTGIFKNWSGDRVRQARLEIIYEYPPSQVFIRNDSPRRLTFQLRSSSGGTTTFALDPGTWSSYNNGDAIEIGTTMNDGSVQSVSYRLQDGQTYFLAMNPNTGKWDVFATH